MKNSESAPFLFSRTRQKTLKDNFTFKDRNAIMRDQKEKKFVAPDPCMPNVRSKELSEA